MKLTPKQKEATKLIEDCDHTLLLGGSRSGKTFKFVLDICKRAAKYPGSRHIILRRTLSAAVKSIWQDTLQNVLKLTNLISACTVNKSEFRVILWNGSEIWVDGLDDKERVDKILGREFNTIFFNEVSQIPSYSTIATVRTRASLKIEGCKNKCFYDMNPTNKFSWAYKVFIQGVNPDTGEPLETKQKYGWMKMNPVDNLGNLAEGYLDQLEDLPEAKKQRFLYGEWQELDGVILTDWQFIESVPDGVEFYKYGLDPGFSNDELAYVKIYKHNNDVYIEPLIYETGLLTKPLYNRIIELGYTRDQEIVIDSASPGLRADLKRYGLFIDKVSKTSTESGTFKTSAAYMMQGFNLYIVRSKFDSDIENELISWHWVKDKEEKQTAKVSDGNDHFIDATIYALWEPKRELKVLNRSLFF